MNQEQNQKMMEWSTAWLLDGDLCRCRKCKRGIVMSRSAESFIHAAGCSQAHLDSPWRDLRAIITPPPSTEPAPQDTGEFGEPYAKLEAHLNAAIDLGEVEQHDVRYVCSVVQGIFGHDLSQVVVVKKEVLGKLKQALLRFKNPTPDGPRCEEMIDSALAALASLNAGGADE